VSSPYRGRIAPSPTGYLHLGHARTFLIARDRAEQAKGNLIFRNEDLDPDRCRPEFVGAMYEDLRWLGLRWSEGPDSGGPESPYSQSERRGLYLRTWRQLRDGGFLYPCSCSRRELTLSATAPNENDDEPIYPGKCRSRNDASNYATPRGVNWRFRVPDGQEIAFRDLHLGPQIYKAGSDFGDFVIWRRDDVPAYQLACVADDHEMRITEVVRGADLLKSTARQLLLYRALDWEAPRFYHCDLVGDDAGVRLSKRHDALSIRALRNSGLRPEQVRTRAFEGV
jgi:glutamyl-tRNA synthetase